MTGAVFYRRDGRLTGFKVSGHTDDSGSVEARIVCSAVSSAVYLTANTLTDVVGAEAEIQVSDGDFSLFVNDVFKVAVTLNARNNDFFWAHFRELLCHTEQRIVTKIGCVGSTCQNTSLGQIWSQDVGIGNEA